MSKARKHEYVCFLTLAVGKAKLIEQCLCWERTMSKAWKHEYVSFLTLAVGKEKWITTNKTTEKWYCPFSLLPSHFAHDFPRSNYKYVFDHSDSGHFKKGQDFPRSNYKYVFDHADSGHFAWGFPRSNYKYLYEVADLGQSISKVNSPHNDGVTKDHRFEGR